MGDFTDLLGQPNEVLPDPLATPATQPPQRKSQFQSLIDGPSEQDLRLGINLNGAASTTPDAHAKAMDIGGTIGAPADSVAANLKETEHLAKLQRYREALTDAPKMSKLLAEDPDIAKLAADEIELLSKNESTFGKILSAFYGGSPEAGSRLADIGRALPAGGLEGTGIAMEGVAALNDVIGRTAARGYRAVGLDALGDLADPATRPWWLNPSAIFGAGGTELRDVGKAVGPDEDRQNLATDIAGGVGQVAAQIATVLLTGGAASTASMFAQGAGILAERVEEQGKTGTAEGDAAIVMGASVTALTEKLGLDALLHRVPPAIRNGILRTLVDIGIGGGIEAVQEVTEGILHNLIALVTIDPNAKLLEGVEQDAKAAGGTGAVIRALVNAATKGRQISSNVQKQQRAGQDAATVEALVKGTADSKLRERNPDAFSAVMAAQTQGTPVEMFYVPAERIAELYQTGGPVVDGVDPLDQIEGLREQIAEAVAVGGDVEISAADYLTHIAPTPLHGALKNDLRASRDGWSVNDAKAYAEDPAREAEVAALVERQAEAVTAAAPGQVVFDQAYADLMDTGRYTSAQAAEEATLTRERFVSRSQRVFGGTVSPEDLYKEARLQILGPTEAGDVAPAGALSQGEPEAYRTQDGATFYRAPDGRMVDNPDPALASRSFDSFDAMVEDLGYQPEAVGGALFQRAAKPLGTDPKEVAHTVIDILYGDTPAQKPNSREVGDIARELMTRGQKALRALGVKGGVIEGPDPKTDEIISRAIAAELKAALEKSSRNASDWYTRKVEEAMTIAALMHPEIATDPIARMGFTAALAITSQGETVPSNVRLADPIYRIFRETGRFPTTVRAKNGPAMTANFEKLNDLLDDLGPEGTHEFLHAKFTVGDLKKRGYPIGGENVGTEVYGSAILGPKIGGGFFQNLNRNYSPVTMDLWFMRAWGRLAGTLVGNTNPESLAKQKARLTAALEAAGRKVPKTDATLEKQAEEIRTAHERDFIKNRKLYDSGEKTKAELTYAAERYLIGLNGINEQPGSGSERVWMRQRVGRAQELLAQEGIKLTAADAQAVWWYPEKDLYATLGGRDSEAINVDYAGALANLAREKGVSDDTITRAVGALDQRSRSAGTTDDAGAEQGGSQSDQGTDGRAGGGGVILDQGVQGSYQQTRDPYGNLTNIIRLTQSSNLSTFLHESGHFYLFQLIDDSFDPRATPEARAKLQADLKVILDHVGIKIDLATATAEQVHAAMTRPAHELWARSFEVYLREGKAPSAALRDAFASFASWLVRIYKSLKTLPDYTKRLTPEVRGVMDRLLATDEAIADAQASASFRVPAALRTVMTTAEQRSLERLTEEATHEARAELQKRVMAELARERREWWKEERARVRGEVETEVRNRPAYRAYNLLRHGETPDGSPTLDADGNPSTTRLDRAGLVQAYGKGILKQLPKGVAAQNGVNHEVFAGLVGFGSGDELRDALTGLQPMKGVIDAETDARMKAKHGDMLTDGKLQADAAEIVLNQKQVELAALQAKVLERLAAGVKAKADKKAASGKREAVKQVRRLQTGLDAQAIAAAAKKAIAAKRLEDAVPAKYRAQADRLGGEVEVAIAKADYELAARLKEQQVVNLALAKEAQDAQAYVGKALKRFGRLRKPDSKLAKGTDVEFVGAARAILARFGLSTPAVGFDQQTWFQRLAEDDPAGAVDMQQMIEAATAGAGQVAARGRPHTRAKSGGAPVAQGDVWRQMTVAEFRSLTDTVDALLHMGRDARSVQIEGERVAIKAAVGEMLAQASGRDSGKRIGQTEAVTPWEKKARSFWATAAFLERVESWARRMDNGKVGPFTKYLLRPVLAAVYEYRAEKTRRIKQLVDILEPRKAELLGKPIHSDELNYTFQNKGALLHALLHSGNDSNFRKLLLGGRGKGFAWGEIDKKTGALDTSKWDRMINRMVRDGTLTKADYDTAQAIWDLLEELKGPAQIAHRKMKGFYFQEVETPGIQTPFGKYRGGYVPAVTDRTLNPEAGARVDANAMGEMANAGILPSVARGFTKSRVEYNQPLELNVSKLTGHMDTVLKFTHLGPVIRDVTRLAINREFRQEMFGIDPHAIDEVLVPWLQRVARQTVEIPPTSEGGRTAATFFKGLQKRTGIQAMAGNLLNAAQQITGISVAMVRVKPHRVLRGLVSSTFAPRHSSQMIMQKSAFMKDRMDSTSMELMTTINDLLEQKSALRKVRDKTDKHGYFAQIYAQNLVDRAVWLGAYEQGIAAGKTEDEAVLEADSVVRTTQGSFAPEDVSRVEVQNAFIRPFLQFYSYFNAQYNLLRTEFDATVTELGWVGGSPRLFYIYLVGAMIPAVLAEAMTQAARGELGDDDDDGLIDDIGELFLLSQLRYFAAMVPGVGPLVNLGIHLGNDKPYDDRLSTAPVFGQAERIVTSGFKLATGSESTAGRAVADALMILGMLTGLPLGQAGKPAGYVADVLTGEQQGETVGDWIRGTLSGREAPKQ
jgi:hypothetical protein